MRAQWDLSFLEVIPPMTIRLAVPLLLLCPTFALAQVQPALNGSFTAVNSAAGDQLDPHVDCDRAPYTSENMQTVRSEIRYFDFATSTDHLIPGGNGTDSLSDVSGTRIAFTEVVNFTSQVAIYDTAAGLPERTHIPGAKQGRPALGGNLVAYEDRSFLPAPNQSEIAVYDLSLGLDAGTRLTNDVLLDQNPALSPSGNVVVWEKCATTGTKCDVFSAVRTGPTAFTTHQLTTTGADSTAENRGPDTNGTLVVYISNKDGDNDIYYQPVAGGTEFQINLPGDQRDVSISGDMVAFESNGGGSQYDIYIWDLRSSIL